MSTISKIWCQQPKVKSSKQKKTSQILPEEVCKFSHPSGVFVFVFFCSSHWQNKKIYAHERRFLTDLGAGCLQGQVPPLLWIYGPLGSRQVVGFGIVGWTWMEPTWQVCDSPVHRKLEVVVGMTKKGLPNPGLRNLGQTKVSRWFDFLLEKCEDHAILCCYACPFESMRSACAMWIHFTYWLPHVATVFVTIDQVILNDTWNTHAIHFVPKRYFFLLSVPRSWIQLINGKNPGFLWSKRGYTTDSH